MRGFIKEVKGSQGEKMVSKLKLGDTRKRPCPRGFQIGVTLDDLLEFTESGGLRGHLK